MILVAASIIQFIMGKPFYVSAYKSLKHKSANMDVLIVIGTSSAWIYGFFLILYGFEQDLRDKKNEYHMRIHSNVHNFETSAVLILIVLFGKFIESYSKMKTIGKLSELAELKVQ